MTWLWRWSYRPFFIKYSTYKLFISGFVLYTSPECGGKNSRNCDVIHFYECGLLIILPIVNWFGKEVGKMNTILSCPTHKVIAYLFLVKYCGMKLVQKVNFRSTVRTLKILGESVNFRNFLAAIYGLNSYIIHFSTMH